MNYTIIKIYADWCFHCINMKNDWEELKSKLSAYPNAPEILDIEQKQMHKLDDFNKNNNLSEPVQANGFPTLVKIVNGQVSYYHGERTTEPMLQWILEDMKSSKISKTSRKSRKSKKSRKSRKASRRRKTRKN